MNLITNNFVITVHMTSLKKYSGSAGPYTMRIDGVDRDGQTFVLNPNKFNPSENYRLITKALTVGDLRLIVIKKPEKDHGRFACTTIDIQNGPNTSTFQCDDILDKHKDTMELAFYETKAYTFTVVPDDNKTLTSDQPLFVQLLGKNGKTALQILSENGAKQVVKS